MTDSSTQPVDIWYTRCGGATASTIAIQQGLLEQEFDAAEVALHSLRDSTIRSVRESHYDHSIQSMFREGGNIPPIWARARGAETAVLGITWVDEFQSIVVRADSEIRGLADLAGRRLAVPLYEGITIDFQRGANFHGLAHGLAIAGLDRGDVRFVDVPVAPGLRAPSGTAELKALFDGQVDVVFLRQASGYQLAQHHGAQLRELVRLTDEADPLRRINNGTPRPLTVHRAFLEKRPDLVVRYLSVLLRAADWAVANPAAAIEAVAREDGRVAAPTIAATFPKLATSLRPRLSADHVRGLEAQKDFLFAWGFLERDFAVADWVVDGPLREAEELVAGGTIAAAAE
ncbi:ABC-type nitrate/sulfonate/bicarbonate transport system substrate-binding protein [Sphingomonas zeicaulis]|uniref:ABC transporter substrate-binding protein n=1 Tax=Sphingomonas zeicaulis TaxID=1632740 RepID=UPI003D2295F2